MLMANLPRNVLLPFFPAEWEHSSFHQQCCRANFTKKEKEKNKIYDVVCVADNTEDEVHTLVQLLINSDTILSSEYLNEAACSQ